MSGYFGSRTFAADVNGNRKISLRGRSQAGRRSARECRKIADPTTAAAIRHSPKDREWEDSILNSDPCFRLKDGELIFEPQPVPTDPPIPTPVVVNGNRVWKF